MSQSACSLSVAIDRAAGSATGPQSRHLTFKPCRRLLGRHSLGSRLQQLNRQAIGALALAFEICSVIGCPCFEPRDLRLQCLDLCPNRAMLPAWRPLCGRGVCRISARLTLTRALPSSESERGNWSRLASERAASGEIFRRAPKRAYVSVSRDIGCSPRTNRG